MVGEFPAPSTGEASGNEPIKHACWVRETLEIVCWTRMLCSTTTRRCPRNWTNVDVYGFSGLPVYPFDLTLLKILHRFIFC